MNTRSILSVMSNKLLWYETTMLLPTPDHPGQREQAGAYDVKPYPRRQTASMDSQVEPAGGVRPDRLNPPQAMRLQPVVRRVSPVGLQPVKPPMRHK